MAQGKRKQSLKGKISRRVKGTVRKAGKVTKNVTRKAARVVRSTTRKVGKGIHSGTRKAWRSVDHVYDKGVMVLDPNPRTIGRGRKGRRRVGKKASRKR